MTARLLLRSAAYAAIVCAGVTAVVGIMHLPVARPLLATLEVLCPVNRVSPEKVERMQGQAVAALMGDVAAPSHEPFGLRLISGREGDVSAWGQGRSFTCETITRGFRYLWCSHVPASALGRLDVDAAHDREVVVALDRTGRPIGVDILSRTTPGSASVALAGVVAQELRDSLGEPHEVHGSFDTGALDGPFQNATLRYRYADYVITLTATNIPGSGVVVREQYLAGNDAGRTK